MHYARNPDIIIRREHFGGIAFNKANGALIEVDRQACIFLENLDGKTSLRNLARQIEEKLNIEINVSELYNVAENLIENDFICKGTDSQRITIKGFPEQQDHLSAPESVHIAVTHRCNYKCPSCYVDNSITEEMTTEEIKALIDEMADMKVFQLAIGGGEPFLRDDLIDIVRYARQKGVIPNITTNGSLITEDVADKLSGYIGQIQISVNGHNKALHESAREKGNFDAVLRSIDILRKHKVSFGINTLLSRDNVNEIGNLMAFVVQQGAVTLNFLRPKPSKLDDNWYEKSRLSSSDYQMVHRDIKNVLGKYPIRITVDCALSFLMNTESSDDLQRHGVYGCSGARRFVSIRPDGSAYPCSFIDSYCGGNIKNGLKDVWQGFDEFRNIQDHLKGKCAVCETKHYCAGCRAISLYETGDITAEEHGCFMIKYS